MRTKLISGIVILLACCGTAQATTSWLGAPGGGDGLRWDDVLNWNAGLPVGGTGSGARTFINETNNTVGGGAVTVLIDSATTAVSGRLILSDNAESDDVTINMTGGTLTVAQGITSSGEQSMHLGSVGKTTFNLSGGVVNLHGRLRQGVDNVAGAQGILNISGGTFNVIPGPGVGDIVMGQGAAQTLQQQINISGGALNATRLLVDDNVASVGGMPMSVVNVTGGAVTVGTLAAPTNWGRNGLYGHVQLDAGTVTVTNASAGGSAATPVGFRLANGLDPVGGLNTVTGTMDITAGLLFLAGDASALVQDYINTGVLTGSGNPLNVLYDYNLTTPGFTTVYTALSPLPPTSTWTGAGDGLNWQVAGNWMGGVPTNQSVANINGASTAQIAAGINAEAKILNMAVGAGDNATLNVNGGTLALTANALIGNTGHGTLNVTAGGAANVTGDVVLGFSDGAANARGTISVNGGTLTTTGTIRLGVGNATAQTQSFTVSGASTVSAAGLSIAQSAGSVGNVTVSGGTLTTTSTAATNLGGAGNGTMLIDGGTVNLGGNLVMGATAGATNAKGTLTISSGSLNMPGRTLSMGGSSSTVENQTLNMSGGTLTASRLLVNDNSPGTTALVNMTGGTMTLGDLAIPTNWGLNGLDGQFDLHGGIVIVNNASTGSTGANPSGFRIAYGLDPVGGLNTVSGSMDITSGALLLTGDRTALIQQYINDGVLTGSAGAILFDYNTTNPGFTTVHTAASSGSISTIWTGGGDGLNWNNGPNWNNGVPDSGKIVGIGGSPTVQIGAGVDAQAGSLALAFSAGTDNVTLNVNGGTLTVGGGIPLGDRGHATLNVTNSSVVTASGDLTLGATDGEANSRGTVTVNNGTINAARLRLGVGNATTLSQDFTLTSGTVNAPSGVIVAEQVGTVGVVTVNGGSLTAGASNIGVNGTGTLDINGGTATFTGFLRIGGSSAADPGQPTAQGSVSIDGGTLDATGQRILLGAARHSTATHTLSMTSGSLIAGALFVSDEADTTALVNMTGGTMTLDTLAIPTNFGEANLNGRFNLKGGTVNVNAVSTGGTQNLPQGFRLANGSGGGSNTVTGKMDITFGTLILEGDAMTLINGYAATDKSLFAYSGTGIVVRSYDGGADKTTVTAQQLGDANRDGIVDIFDVNVVSANWMSGPDGDVNGNGIVDIFDVNVMSAHWMQTNPDGGGAGPSLVPEPASMLTLAVGAALLALKLRGRRRFR